MASIVNYGRTAKNPIFIFTLNKDSIVSPLNSLEFIRIGADNPLISNYQFENEKFHTCTFSNIPSKVDHIGA